MNIQEQRDSHIHLSEPERALAYLESVESPRRQAGEIWKKALRDELLHFHLDLKALGAAEDFVISVIKKDYPSLEVPYHSRWRHFEGGTVDRMAILEEGLRSLSPLEKGSRLFDLVMISVFLDAGAGDRWVYKDALESRLSSRSEGLALASYDLFCRGFFSAHKKDPWRVDASRLLSLREADLADGLQVSRDNPLLALEGRLALLRNIGAMLERRGSSEARLGFLFAEFYEQASKQQNKLSASVLFSSVLRTFQSVWPSRLTINGKNLGDVWFYPGIEGPSGTDGLMPFHKLSFWLSYSLLEPLIWAGIEISEMDKLCGLAEYRNGGLFVDSSVLVPKNPGILAERHPVSSTVIVEWRALTLSLLDVIAQNIRKKLAKSSQELTLAQVLQGGTWTAGRILAAQKRKFGPPPLMIESDGTVF
ncbi:MAG: DUF1688 family protein [Oligoflexales bacterium]|nr:DUF1688 family protein [Oligoflexales bacterium]